MLLNFLKSVRTPIQRCHFRNMTKAVRSLSGNISVDRKCTSNKFNQKWLFNSSYIQIRRYSNPLPPSNNLDEVLVDANTYEIVCNETLESLCDYFDELVDSNPSLKDADILYGDGVLTVKLGSNKGTYVINRQSPNRQIWLSSPMSGPKRYDFFPSNDQVGEKCEGCWIYKHDGVTLHELLQLELPKLIGMDTDFTGLSHGRR